MRLFRYWAPALVLSSLIGFTANAQPQTSDLETARKLVADGKSEQALAILDSIIAAAMLEQAKDPKAVCPGIAASYLLSYMPKGTSISIEDDWCEAMLVKGFVLNDLKRHAEAEQVLDTLVGHDPGNPHYLAEYAFTVRVNGGLERSVELYKNAEKLAADMPQDSDGPHWRAVALRGQGYGYVELKRWDDAVKAYRQSLKFEPDSTIAASELKWIEDNRPD